MFAHLVWLRGSVRAMVATNHSTFALGVRAVLKDKSYVTTSMGGRVMHRQSCDFCPKRQGSRKRRFVEGLSYGFAAKNCPPARINIRKNLTHARP
jgi:hypothetical protein